METRRNNGLTDFLKRLSFAAVLLLTLLPAAASAQYKLKGADITSGLVAHFKFDETSGAGTAVNSGGANNGTLTGMDAATDWIPGKMNNALDFDGSNDYVSVNYYAALGITSGTITLSAWIRPGAFPGSGTADFIMDRSSKYKMMIYNVNGGPNLAFGFQNGSDFWESTNNEPFTGTLGSTWYHVAATYDDAANTIRLYVNGVEQPDDGAASAQSVVNDETTPLRIGEESDGGADNFNGAIDDVRIYNRTLSGEEVKQLYHTSSLDIHQDSNADLVLSTDAYANGLVGHWTLDGSGNTSVATDSSGNGNNGTLNGFPADPSASWVEGPVGGALNFDGSNDNIVVPRASVLEPSTAITVSAWINWDTHTTGVYQKVVHKPEPNEVDPWTSYAIGQDSNSQSIRFEAAISGTYRTTANVTSFPLDQWVHVAGTWESGDRLRFYVNGAEATTSGSTYSGTINYWAADLGIGETTSTELNTEWDGMIDDVRIYNRKLTATEIAGLYNLEKARITTAGRVKTAAGIQPGWENTCNSGNTGIIRYNSGGGGSNWYAGYSYRRPITIESSLVAANATGFPLALMTTLNDLKTTANGGKVQSSTGLDIVFTGSDGTTLLDYEQEKYVASTGEVVYWIKADVNASTDQTIYMYYGKAGASDLSDATNVWPSTYKAVWHLNDDPQSTADGNCGGGTKETCNSTSNNNDLDNTNGQVASTTGAVDGGATFDGDEDYLRMPNAASTLDGINTITISLWVYPRAQATTRTLVMKGGEYRLTLEADTNRRIFFTTSRWSSGNQWSIPTGNISANAWNHVVVTYNVTSSANDPLIYVNGVSKTVTNPTPATGPAGTTNGVWIGEDWTNVNDIDGNIDEVRISDTIMSANDITTMYNNMANNSSFMVVGSQAAGASLEFCDGSAWKTMAKAGSSSNCTAGSMDYTTVGGHTLTVDSTNANCTFYFTVGGGGGGGNSGDGGFGGENTFTYVPGTTGTFNIRVGGGGGGNSTNGGGGGGASWVNFSGTILSVAGGGGGGGGITASTGGNGHGDGCGGDGLGGASPGLGGCNGTGGTGGGSTGGNGNGGAGGAGGAGSGGAGGGGSGTGTGGNGASVDGGGGGGGYGGGGGGLADRGGGGGGGKVFTANGAILQSASQGGGAEGNTGTGAGENGYVHVTWY